MCSTHMAHIKTTTPIIIFCYDPRIPAVTGRMSALSEAPPRSTSRHCRILKRRRF